MQHTDKSPISEDLVPGSRKLFLFFGGIAGAIGMPPFEFYRASQILDCSKVFFRDPSQSWYQRGLPGIGTDAFAIGEYLTKKIEESGVSEVIFVGNSMGGYAALLFCSMLGYGKVIAFVPQTFVCTEKRLKHGDRRWPNQIAAVHKTRAASDIYDLRPWIQSRFPEMQANVYVSTSDVLDMRHANELVDFSNINIHYFPDAGHGLVTKLRDDGVLAQILNS